MSAVPFSRALAVVAALAMPASAGAEAPPPKPGAHALRASAQGVAVLAACRAPASLGASAPDPAAAEGCEERARALARAVYASALRPRRLDEVRARVLVGAPAPPSATKEVRELAEVRAAIVGDDAASRRLLADVAEQLGVEGLLVVSARRAASPGPSLEAPPGEPEPPAMAAPPGEPELPSEAAPAKPEPPSSEAAPVESEPSSEAAPAEPEPPPSEAAAVSARLFLTARGAFDAARYEPEGSAGGPGAWRGTVASLTGRFPPAARPLGQLEAPAQRLPSGGKEAKPLYASPWLWGAVGAAALLGGFFWLGSQDTSKDPIHLRMKLPE